MRQRQRCDKTNNTPENEGYKRTCSNTKTYLRKYGKFDSSKSLLYWNTMGLKDTNHRKRGCRDERKHIEKYQIKITQGNQKDYTRNQG